jgi:hypothetical protein
MSAKLCININGKLCPKTGHEGLQEEYMYSSTLSLTSAVDGGGWLTPRTGRFFPSKETQYPLYKKLGGPQGPSGSVKKTSPPPGFDSLTFQSVASRYTDWAISAHIYLLPPYLWTNIIES